MSVFLLLKISSDQPSVGYNKCKISGNNLYFLEFFFIGEQTIEFSGIYKCLFKEVIQ